MEIKVALVEDDEIYRNALGKVVKSNHSLELVGSYQRAEDFIDQFRLIRPEVVLMDIHLPGMNGIECMATIKFDHPEVQFIMCTVYEEEDLLYDSLKYGATGYMLKKAAPRHIAEAILDVKRGGSPMSASIARKVVNFFQAPPVHPAYQELSGREKEILILLSKGYRYKEIAEKVFLSINTVRTHIRNIYIKLQVSSRTEAINKIFGKAGLFGGK